MMAMCFPFLCSLPFKHRHMSPAILNLSFPRLTCLGLLSRFHSLQETPCLRRHLLAYACISRGDEFNSESKSKASTSNSEELSFDMKLPRRNLLVQFTCKSCGERTQRIINRQAYERGTVFVQCAGCLVNHKLIDNLGLITEYDLRNDKEIL